MDIESIRFKSNKSKVIPKAILKAGLTTFCSFGSGDVWHGGWLKIKEVLDDGILGQVVPDQFPGQDHLEYIVPFHKIERLRGTPKWNIENLYVFCSDDVLSGAQIGYLFDSLVSFPMHYGWIFYSVNERFVFKNQLLLNEVLLKDLAHNHEEVIPHLESFAFYGLIKDNEGVFSALTSEQAKDRNRNIILSYDYFI